jgi:hypothetical protein
MTLALLAVARAFHTALLHAASLIVPMDVRGEWRREWQSELWHVRQTCVPGPRLCWRAERQVAAFCLGAFEDALCLRREHVVKATPPLASTVGSPMRCVAVLVMLIVASGGVGFLLPGVRSELQSSPYRDTRNLMLIEDAQFGDDSVATIEVGQFQAWIRRRQTLFDGFAFYRLESATVSNGSGASAVRTIARGSMNLFTLLGLPVRFAKAKTDAEDVPGVILSDALWKHEYGGDSGIGGRMIRVGARAVRVVGVAPRGAWRLPGRVDAWLMEPAAAMTPGKFGFVVAHLKPSAEHNRWSERWSMTVPRADGGADDFLCVSLEERTRGPFGTFLFMVMLACLALPATTSLPLGEYRVNSRKLSWSTRLRRWSFLAVKIALLMPVVYFVSLDLAHLRSSFDPVASAYILIVSSFSICLFGLRWTLRDQRQRCPVCLGRLTHPARVGEPSRNFLGWNGMELICVGGHGLLHVPEIQTSWFSTQRWLYLDPSWEVLFGEPVIASAGYL